MIDELAESVLDLMRAVPDLTVCDGVVSKAVTAPYVLAYFLVMTPDGLTEPDKVPFSGDSDVIDLRIYCHCVGDGFNSAGNARKVQGLVRGALLNTRLEFPGRTCFPVRWFESQPQERNEETLKTITDNVDVYRWVTKPA